MSHEVNDRVWEDVWEAVEQMSLEEVKEFLLSNLHSQEEVTRLNEVELREAVAEDMFNLRGV
jgi:ethanolamine ammonia-lyase large subunit|tara:strand:- start:132 stop:317 length:186 start_codon:yes stop_codon:yes gene_type:complete